MATRRGRVETDSKTETLQIEREMTETDGFKRLNLNAADEYWMNHKRRGSAFIFNYEKFYPLRRLPPRTGTNIDYDNLEKQLKGLDFEVFGYQDAKQTTILDAIKGASVKDYSNDDCFLMAFLSHGDPNNVYTFDSMISVPDIIAKFKGDKCPSLAGKPKIFIFQACRGCEYDTSVVVNDAVDSQESFNEVEVDAGGVNTLPAGADFLMCYSVAEGYYSHRNTYHGSWYIQDLCELLRDYGSSLEFTELLTLVNRKVARRSVWNKKMEIETKQIPCFASMLTKKLYFRDK